MPPTIDNFSIIKAGVRWSGDSFRWSLWLSPLTVCLQRFAHTEKWALGSAAKEKEALGRQYNPNQKVILSQRKQLSKEDITSEQQVSQWLRWGVTLWRCFNQFLAVSRFLIL